MKSISLRVLVGTLAALIAWAIMEPSAPKDVGDPRWEIWEGMFIPVLGGFIGAGVGAINGFLTGGKVHTLRGLILGLLFGVAGITIGAKVGMILVAGTFGEAVFKSGNLVTTVLARVLALTPIGAGLGLGIGASSLSPKRVTIGAIGGALGGAVGGALFDIVGGIIGGMIIAAKGIQPGHVAEVGATSRAIYAIALGAGIGLFIGIVENLAKSAWLRQSFGRNEGREWPLYGQHTVIGRSETATIPIFGDPSLMPFHATITKHDGQYYISDGGGGVLLDGYPVSQAPLYSGATIQVGQTVLQFLMKEGHAPMRAAEPYGTPVYPVGGAQPVPQAPVGYMGQPPGVPTMVAPAAMAPGSQPTVMTPMPSSQPTVMTPGQATSVTLVATDGPLAGQRYPVMQPIEVGRDCPAIPISFDTSASRRHASIGPAAGGLAVTDLGSTNGVFVNGQRVQSALVTRGGVVKIGATTFMVE